MFLLCFVVTFLAFWHSFSQQPWNCWFAIITPTYLNCTKMYKDIWFLATQNTFKNRTKLGAIYVMRQIWQSRDNMWSHWTQWVEILEVAFHFFMDIYFHKIFVQNSCYNSTVEMKSQYEGAETHWEPVKVFFWQIQQFTKLAFAESSRGWFAVIFCCPIIDGMIVIF